MSLPEDIQNAINNAADFPMNGGQVIFFAFFSQFIALFHSVIFRSIYGIRYKPAWLLFVLYPVFLLILYMAAPQWVLISFLVLFISTFLFALLGIIVIAPVRSLVTAVKKDKNFQRKYPDKRNLPGKYTLGALFTGVLFVSFLFFGPLGFIITLVLSLLINTFKKGSSYHFYRLERHLPTSKIRSVAMGLSEIEGRLVMDAFVTAPIKNKKCIGYQYVIEQISHDKDGKETLTTEHSEIKIEPFQIKDDTGSIRINTTRLTLLRFAIDEQYRSGSRQYTQYLLQEGDEVMLIGKASAEEHNTPVMVYDDFTRQFTITPKASVTAYHTMRPALNALLSYFIIWILMVAVILSTPMHIGTSGLVIEKPKWFVIHIKGWFTKETHAQNPEVISDEAANDTLIISTPNKEM